MHRMSDRQSSSDLEIRRLMRASASVDPRVVGCKGRNRPRDDGIQPQAHDERGLEALNSGLSCCSTSKYASSRGRGNVRIPKGFPRSVERVKSRLLGFRPFPYSVISMACFGNAYQKITVTTKARFGDRNHLSEMPTNRPDANFLFADRQVRMRRVATLPGSTVALVANESINQHFKSPAENFCRW
jgi:hypothetical protein